MSHLHCCLSRTKVTINFLAFIFSQTVISSKFYHECPWNIDCIISVVFPPWSYVVQFNKEQRAGIFTTLIKYWGSLPEFSLTLQCTGTPTSSITSVKASSARTAPSNADILATAFYFAQSNETSFISTRNPAFMKLQRVNLLTFKSSRISLRLIMYKILNLKVFPWMVWTRYYK